MAKKRRRLRMVLIGLAVVLLLAGGGIAYLFLFPAKPAITSETSLSCDAVAQCSRDCALRCPSGARKLPCMGSCTKRCAERGCPGAKETFLEMTGCVRSNCLWKCMGGPGPECDGCAETECADERAVCLQHVCADTAPAQDGSRP